MAAPRKPVSEKAIPRQVTFKPWVDEFLDAFCKPGARSEYINHLIEDSPEFRTWWKATTPK